MTISLKKIKKLSSSFDVLDHKLSCRVSSQDTRILFSPSHVTSQSFSASQYKQTWNEAWCWEHW